MQDLEINRLEAGTAEAPTVQRLINGATRMPWGQAMSCKKMGFEPVDMELS